jgi:hypothetical protein
MAKELIKVSKDTPKTNNEKSKFWSQNKNVTNDRVVDETIITKGPTIHLKFPSTPNTFNTQTRIQDQTLNVVQNNQQRRGPPCTKRTYTPLGEPIKSVLKKFLL